MSLLKFLINASENKEVLDAFSSDPEKAMNDAGLSEEEKEAIRSGDNAKISTLIGPEAQGVAAFLNAGVHTNLD